jgi:structure-specific recognition protein 1
MNQVSKIVKNWYGVAFENREHSLRGWNWGKVDFGKTELAFNVGPRPAFEIPYTEIMNTNLAGKNEVAVEFNLTDHKAANGSNGTNGTNGKGGMAGAGMDELVEMRFYIPGAATKRGEDEEEGEEREKDEEEEEAEPESAANVFYETIIEKAEIGEVAGVTFATFLDVLHLTPRGRFDLDLFEQSFRLRGKSYDYKIQYDSIKKFMLLPKPDEIHDLITVGLDPPLRQGQTRYPFLVMQFKKEEDVTLDLNMTDEMLKKYERLQAHYEAPISAVIAQVFRGLTGKKIITPAQSFTTVHGQRGLKCSIKANEGLLYCLEKSFLFVPKPATYVAFDNVAVITLSRVGGAMAASRTFDVTMSLKQGMGEYQFSNINREEQSGLEVFFKSKGLKVKNEIEEVSTAASDETGINCFRQTRSLPKLCKMLTMMMTMTWSTWIVALQMKMKRALTMISKKTVIQISQKSLTHSTRAKEAVVMKKAKETTMSWTLMKRRSDRRKRPKSER